MNLQAPGTLPGHGLGIARPPNLHNPLGGAVGYPVQRHPNVLMKPYPVTSNQLYQNSMYLFGAQSSMPTIQTGRFHPTLSGIMNAIRTTGKGSQVPSWSSGVPTQEGFAFPNSIYPSAPGVGPGPGANVRSPNPIISVVHPATVPFPQGPPHVMPGLPPKGPNLTRPGEPAKGPNLTRPGYIPPYRQPGPGRGGGHQPPWAGGDPFGPATIGNV